MLNIEPVKKECTTGRLLCLFLLGIERGDAADFTMP